MGGIVGIAWWNRKPINCISMASKITPAQCHAHQCQQRAQPFHICEAEHSMDARPLICWSETKCKQCTNTRGCVLLLANHKRRVVEWYGKSGTVWWRQSVRSRRSIVCRAPDEQLVIICLTNTSWTKKQSVNLSCDHTGQNTHTVTYLQNPSKVRVYRSQSKQQCLSSCHECLQDIVQIAWYPLSTVEILEYQ